MSTEAHRTARIATLAVALLLALAAAVATTTAATHAPRAPASCGQFALSAPVAPGLWELRLPRDTSPNLDGSCPEGYEPGYETTVCSYDPGGNVYACVVEAVCVPAQPSPDGLAGSAG